MPQLGKFNSIQFLFSLKYSTVVNVIYLFYFFLCNFSLRYFKTPWTHDFEFHDRILTTLRHWAKWCLQMSKTRQFLATCCWVQCCVRVKERHREEESYFTSLTSDFFCLLWRTQTRPWSSLVVQWKETCCAAWCLNASFLSLWEMILRKFGMHVASL